MTKRNGSGCVFFLVLMLPFFYCWRPCLLYSRSCLWSQRRKQERWDKFSISHNRRVVQKVIGSTHTGYGVGVTTNGKVGTVITTTSTPAKPDGFAMTA